MIIKNRKACVIRVGDVPLLPGVNFLEADKAELIKAEKEALERLTAKNPDDEDYFPPLQIVEEEKKELTAYPETAAISLVNTTLDRGTLRKLRSKEKRAPVVAAIDAQLEKMNTSDKEKDDGK